MNNAKEKHVAHLIPYPAKLIGDVGLGFGHGLLFGSAYALIKGIRNSSNAQHRLIEGFQAVHKNGYGSRLGGRFAAWTALFHAFDFTIDAVTRSPDQKERPILYLGACVGGFVNMRRGIGDISKWAVLGEGIGALPEAYFVMEKNSLGCSPMEERYLHKKKETIWTNKVEDAQTKQSQQDNIIPQKKRHQLGCSPMEEIYWHKKKETIWTNKVEVEDAQTQQSQQDNLIPQKKSVLSYLPFVEHQKENFLMEEHKETDHNHNSREEKGSGTQQLHKPPGLLLRPEPMVHPHTATDKTNLLHKGNITDLHRYLLRPYLLRPLMRDEVKQACK